MIKVIKIAVIVLLLALVGMFILNYYMSEDMPTGESGPAADALAQTMMEACNADAWAQTRYVQWTFAGANTYLWDRSKSMVRLNNGDGYFIIDSSTGVGIGRGESGRESISTEDAADAWANFCNDSFWLIAPMKVMDIGVRRELVQSEEEGKALLVHYDAGGVTPGDSYLWHIADDGLPYAIRLWTQSPPLNGIKASWTDWQQLHTGALIATRHMISKANVGISDLKSGSHLAELGLDIDPFE